MFGDALYSLSSRLLSIAVVTLSFHGSVIGLNRPSELLTDTYCQLEAMTARCRWNSEVVVMTSARWGRMEANRCLQIHPNVLAALGHDPLFLGCSDDVLSLVDSKCSGRSECEIHIPDPDLDQVKPCYQDLKSYLTASYSCVKVVSESRRCVVSVKTEAQFISSSLSTSSDVNSVSASCGSKAHPWRLEAAAGQHINISLLDFTAMSMSDRPAARVEVTCRQYGYVLEKWNKRNVSVCAGGRAQLRHSHVYVSHSNNVHIVQTASDDEHSFLIKVESVGCTNMIPPENAWLRRSNNDIIIGCYSSQQTWQLHCDGHQWKGLVGTCPELYSGSVIISEENDNESTVLTVMMLIAGAAVFICITVIALGCLLFNRYSTTGNDSDTEKLNMSDGGGGATGVYLSNSRCVRSIDKPVDNNAFTSRLPVSPRPLHHHRRQQQLTRTSDNTTLAKLRSVQL